MSRFKTSVHSFIYSIKREMFQTQSNAAVSKLMLKTFQLKSKEKKKL